MTKTIQRDRYLNKLISRKENGLIKVITGIRRCGKSYLLFKLFYEYLLANGVKEEQIITIALDDDANEAYRDPKELSKYIRSKITDSRETHYVLLDEVQEAIQREELQNAQTVRLYNVLNGIMHLGNVDMYVTGSNSKMLTKDVLTAFRGRADAVAVYPLSFGEYYSVVGGDKAEAFETYALYGGMPLLATMSTDEEKFNYLKSLFDMVFFKDITERYSIELPGVLSELTDVLCSSVGSLTNPTKITNTLKSVKGIAVSGDTVSKYLSHLTESFLFSAAKRYDVKGKKYFSYPSKYYCTDIGLRNVRLNLRQQEETHIMENVIYNELVARGFLVDVGVVDFYTRGSKGTNRRKTLEIDFVINRGAKRYYIQSALNTLDPQKKETELRPLLHTGDFFKKIIITKTGMKPWTDELGILHLGLYEFLLNENAIDL